MALGSPSVDSISRKLASAAFGRGVLLGEDGAVQPAAFFGHAPPVPQRPISVEVLEQWLRITTQVARCRLESLGRDEKDSLQVSGCVGAPDAVRDHGDLVECET